jgi:hypothetical protein
MTVRLRTFSQALLAVRSAGAWRRDGMLPASAPAGRAFRADKRDAFGLTVQVHWLRNISSTAATWAVVRSQYSPPSGLRHCHRQKREIRCRLFCVTNHEQIRLLERRNILAKSVLNNRKCAETTSSASQSHTKFSARLRSFGTALGGVQKHADIASCDFAAIT